MIEQPFDTEELATLHSLVVMELHNSKVKSEHLTNLEKKLKDILDPPEIT